MRVQVPIDLLGEFKSVARVVLARGFSYRYIKSDGEVEINADFSQEEIAKLNDWQNSPEFQNIVNRNKFNQARELILDRIVLQEVIGNPRPSQEVKDKAQAKLNIVNQKLIDMFS